MIVKQPHKCHFSTQTLQFGSVTKPFAIQRRMVTVFLLAPVPYMHSGRLEDRCRRSTTQLTHGPDDDHQVDQAGDKQGVD